MSARDKEWPDQQEPRHDVPVSGGAQASTIEIVRPFVRGGSSFAGAAALELRGREALAPDRLASTLPLDWQAEALGFVQAVCAERRNSGAEGLTLPPVALLGEPGSGRTHFVRQLSNHSGLPYCVWDLSREMSAEAGSPYAIAVPPGPLVAMIASRCANPIFVVVGVEEAHRSAIEQIAGMLDPRTNRRRVEHSIGATVDYSNVTWIVVPTSDALLPSQLEPLLRPLRLFKPTRADHRLAMLDAIDEAVFNLGLDRTPQGIQLDDLVGRSPAAHGFSSIYEHAHAAVQAHAPS